MATEEKILGHILKSEHRQRHKCTNDKKCLDKTIFICIKQHLSNIKSQFIKYLNNNEAKLKRALLIKKPVASKAM